MDLRSDEDLLSGLSIILKLLESGLTHIPQPIAYNLYRFSYRLI